MFDPREVETVLANLRHRWPEATIADAKNIILDGMRQERDERLYAEREDAERERELDDMAVSA